MKYRFDKDDLLAELAEWNRYFNRTVHLIACGGTALTLIGVKESTKDVDFTVPSIPEYNYLIRILEELGYKRKTIFGWSRGGTLIFDLFIGNYVYTTELLNSPLDDGGNSMFFEYTHIYLGILNYYDLLITKIFRSTSVDIQDCLNLIKLKKKEINMGHFEKRYRETASYDTSEKRDISNLKNFLRVLKKDKIHE